MKTFVIALSSCLAFATLGHAQDDASDRAMVDAYMDAYSAADFDAMEGSMADDILFVDPTATDQGEDGLVHRGRDEVMAALRDFAARYGPLGLNFEWTTVFESNDRYVFMGRVNATYPVEQEGMVFRWSAPQTTVLHVRDGLVVEQFDFADYEGAEQGLVPADATKDR